MDKIVGTVGEALQGVPDRAIVHRTLEAVAAPGQSFLSYVNGYGFAISVGTPRQR